MDGGQLQTRENHWEQKPTERLNSSFRVGSVAQDGGCASDGDGNNHGNELEVHLLDQVSWTPWTFSLEVNCWVAILWSALPSLNSFQSQTGSRLERRRRVGQELPGAPRSPWTLAHTRMPRSSSPSNLICDRALRMNYDAICVNES